MQRFDCIIIGGGPAGLSAAVYLGRFNRSVLILDNENGRWDTYEINENYLGFPKGIASRKLRNLGIKQAKKFGAKFVIDTVTSVKKENNHFKVFGKKEYQAKTLLFATGVTDLFPEFHKWKACLGRSLFWCITCDGHKAENKKALVIGRVDSAAATAMQLLNYTDMISFLTNCDVSECEISEEFLNRLKNAKIRLYHGKIQDVESKKGMLRKVILDDGTVIDANFMLNQQGSIPKSDLAKSLNVKVNKAGYVLTDNEQRTNILGIYAAGDVTKEFAHQVVTAAHEGSMAAQSINYDLYKPNQKEE